MKLSKIKKLHGRGARVQQRGYPPFDHFIDVDHLNPNLEARVHPEDKGKFKSNWFTDPEELVDGVWYEIETQNSVWLANGCFFSGHSYPEPRFNIDTHTNSNPVFFNTLGICFKPSFVKARKLYPKEIETLYTKYPEAKPKECPCTCIDTTGMIPPKDYCATVKVADTPMNTVVKDFFPKQFKIGEEVYVKGVIVSVCGMAGGNSEVKFTGKDGVDYNKTYQFINEDILKSKACV